MSCRVGTQRLLLSPGQVSVTPHQTGLTNFSVSSFPALHGFSVQHSAFRIPCRFIHASPAFLHRVTGVIRLELL